MRENPELQGVISALMRFAGTQGLVVNDAQPDLSGLTQPSDVNWFLGLYREAMADQDDDNRDATLVGLSGYIGLGN